MKKFMVFALAALLAAALVAAPASAESVSGLPNTITVNGSATVSVTPDIVVVSLGVQETAKEVTAAQKQAGEKLNAIVEALQAAGLPAVDISTSDYSIYANTDYSSFTGKTTLNGYNATAMLSIKVRDVDNVGAYIDAAVAAGANQINNIGFDREDRAQYIDQALVLAIQDAARKAAAMAQAAGREMGAAIQVTEGTTGGYYALTSNVSYSAADSEYSTKLQSGTLDIQVKVTVVYTLI